YANLVSHILDVEFRDGQDDAFRQDLAGYALFYASPQFIDQLSKDHQAALGFLNDLSPTDLDTFATSNGRGFTDGIGPVGANEFFEVAASAMKACTPAQADLLYKRIAGPDGVLSSVDPQDPGAVIPYVADFVASYAALESTPPAPGEDLTHWAKSVGVSFMTS